MSNLHGACITHPDGADKKLCIIVLGIGGSDRRADCNLYDISDGILNRKKLAEVVIVGGDSLLELGRVYHLTAGQHYSELPKEGGER